MCLNELLKKAWENPKTKYWFISPIYSQAEVQYRRLIQATPKEIIIAANATNLRIELINNSVIEFKSGETFDRLRGDTIHGVVVDEVRDQHPDLFKLVIRPMLTTTRGWAAFVSTPNGFDQFYDLYNQAESDTTGEWYCMQAPSSCNPLITERELDDAKKILSEAQFAQEYLAEFRDLTSGKAYVNFGSWNLREDNPFYSDGIINPNLPILIAMDFNLSPMAWTLGQKKADHFHFFDEIHLKGSHTQEAAEVLAAKIREFNPKFGVLIAGDASSSAGQRAAAGQSDYDIVCQTLDRYKIKWENVTPESNPHIKDRVNTVNAKLKSATGEVSLTLNPVACPHLKKDFERVVWKAGGGDRIILDQTTNPDLTHQSDGIGYAICALSPLVYNAAVPTLRIIRR
jgi:hypothetical protein